MFTDLVTSLRDKLDEIWFTMYTRSGSIVGSSGFEHVFIGELKNGAVSGFHNWVSFQKEESEGDLDYEGYEKIVDLGTRVSRTAACCPLVCMYVCVLLYACTCVYALLSEFPEQLRGDNPRPFSGTEKSEDLEAR